MTRLVTLGGVPFPFGEDDVIDYLSQYGVVSEDGVMGQCGWMAKVRVDFTSCGQHDRLWYTPNVKEWVFFFLPRGGLPSQAFGNRIDVAVRHYLTLGS